MVTIRLLGEAGRKFTRRLELDVSTVGEAVRALCAVFPGFDTWLLEADARGIGWRVVVDDPAGLSEEQVLQDAPIPRQLILAPIIRGRGPILLIVAGVALLGTAFAIGIGTVIGATLLSVGLSLLFQGIASLLSPTAIRREALRKTSFLFTGSNLSAVQGISMPLLYGETIIQSPPPLSFGISLEP